LYQIGHKQGHPKKVKFLHHKKVLRLKIKFFKPQNSQDVLMERFLRIPPCFYPESFEWSMKKAGLLTYSLPEGLPIPKKDSG
jgi:hypothetical protein